MVPVRTVDGRAIGSRVPGPVQQQVWREWDTFVGLDTREQARVHLNVTTPERVPVR